MGRTWSTEEEAVLLYFASSGMPYDVVAKIIKLKCGTDHTEAGCSRHVKDLRALETERWASRPL